MLACDLMGLVAQFTVVVPMTFAGKIVRFSSLGKYFLSLNERYDAL